MGQRLDLQTLLLTICPNVYFQPPVNVDLVFPCIIYSRDWAVTNFADDEPYKHVRRYSLMVVDQEADSDLLDPIAQLPMCVYDRHYTAKDLHHDVYKIFF